MIKTYIQVVSQHWPVTQCQMISSHLDHLVHHLHRMRPLQHPLAHHWSPISQSLGHFIQGTQSLAEICGTLDGLSNADKYALMFQHVLSQALFLMVVTESLILVGLGNFSG